MYLAPSQFPPICVDGFFPPYDAHFTLSNPESGLGLKGIVDIGNNCEYKNVGSIRGVRSEPLHLLNQTLFERVNLNIIRSYYPVLDMEKIGFQAQTFFQQSEYDINDGWVHDDEGLITAIIFLTPNGTSGTSIYDRVDNKYDIDPGQKKKQDYFINYKKYSGKEKEELQKLKQKNNSCFKKTCMFTGEFNRMIAFAAPRWHAAELHEKTEKRLIIISFIKEITGHIESNWRA